LVKRTKLVAPTGAYSELLNLGPERLKAMDEQGIDVEVLSVNPFWYSADRELARDLIKLQNEKLAAMCATNPDRFVGLATVALQFPDLAAEQLEEGVTKLGLRGGSIGGQIPGSTEELASPRFDPFWAKAEQLGVVIFMHPASPPEIASRIQGSGALSVVLGNPLATTLFLTHMIFEGTLDRFPGLKLCCAHGGGYLPSYADRSDRGCLVFPEQCKAPTLKKHPTEYLKQIYFDSLVFSPEGLRHLVAQCGASQIMVGTDYPYPWTNTPVDHVLRTPGLRDADRIAILGGNAATLLGLGS
jgi:aminocarboxymuconate-semialdehyde decarboxylase